MSCALIRVSALALCLLSVSPLVRAFAAEQAPLDLSKPFLLIQTTDSDQLAAVLEQASAAGMKNPGMVVLEKADASAGW